MSVSALAVACGGTKTNASTGGPSTTDTDGGPNNPNGYPSCGTDPANQPSPCVDSLGVARCKSAAGYPGDELALCAPTEADGLFIHFGPDDPTDPAQVQPYILATGGEEEFCMHKKTANTDQRFFTAYHGRMRPNSHHWIVTMPTTQVPDDAVPYICGPQIIDRWLFGSQSPQIDVSRVSGGEAPAQPGDPDYGAAHDIPASQTMLMDLHYVNSTDAPILREAWARLDYVDPASVKVHVDLIAFTNVGINVPPHSNFTTHRVTCAAPATTDPIYLGFATAHAHARMQRASIYRTAADGSTAATGDLVYESHDWHEQDEAYFRDGVANPPLPVTTGSWGAQSGYLKFMPGDQVSWECQYQNDTDTTMTFGDSARTNEMCEIFGFYYPSAGKMWECFGS